MLKLYRFLTQIIFFIIPLIFFYRLIKKKEDLISIQQKLLLKTKKIKNLKTIWLHGASVGELQSIIPLLEIYNNNKNIERILITSNTQSSSEILKNLKLKKIIHQFFPFDSRRITKKFLSQWQPNIAIFIDSEIWPNMIFNIKEKKIPLILLNGRITKKSFLRWKFFSKFAKSIFSQFDLCLTANKETKIYLKKLGSNNIKYLGNLKFSQSKNEDISLEKSLKNFIKKKVLWCASSTHFNEELYCGNLHKELKKRFKNLLTIIIPRHIHRTNSIVRDLEKIDLKVHLDFPKKKIDKNTDIYLVNSYGKTKAFYANCKNIFLGGSLINRGGQNPLEAARYGCKILYGKYIGNFEEIYKFLNKKKISYSFNTIKHFKKKLEELILKNQKIKENKKNPIKKIGLKILKKTKNEIDKYYN